MRGFFDHDAVLLAGIPEPDRAAGWLAAGLRVGRAEAGAADAGLALLEASRHLEVDPTDTVVVAWDDTFLEAARRHRYATVLDLRQTPWSSLDGAARRRRPEDLPDALEARPELEEQLRGRQLAVFLDYDGTLAPIVPHPDRAVLAPGMREAVQRLAEGVPVCIVSGRDRPDVARFVDLQHLIYAGSHGFDIRGPDLAREHPEGAMALPDLDAAERSLEEALRRVEGAEVERKRFSVAVHHRRVAEDRVPEVFRAVDEVLAAHPSLRRSGGKKVIELQPDVDWHKGRAVTWLLEALSLEDAFALYVGDDRTDEDAFHALEGRGLGILVGLPARPTAARYRLEDPEAVRRFLSWLAEAVPTQRSADT